MAKKLEMEPQSFRSDSEGAKAKLQGAIREVNIEFEGCVKYLPPLVKSHRNQVVHLNTSTPPRTCGKPCADGTSTAQTTSLSLARW